MVATLFQPDDDRSRIEFTFHVLRKYLEVSERDFDRGCAELAEDLRETQPKPEGSHLPAEEAAEFTAVSALNRLVFYRHNLVGRMRYGFVIQLYSAVESEGKFLCQTLKNRHPQLNLDASKMKNGEEIMRGFRVMGAPEILLLDLDRLRLLRNALAHANGFFAAANPKQKGAISDLIAANVGISLDREDYVQVDKSYCDHALGMVEQLFELLFEQHHFGQAFFFGKTYGYGLASSPTAEGLEHHLITPEEVDRLLETDEFRQAVEPVAPAVNPDGATKPAA